MPKKTKSEVKTTRDKQHGRKGGLSMLDPQMLGAMVGAAIGGLTGLALGNKQTRNQIVHAKDKIVEGVSDVVNDIEIESEPLKKKLKN